MEAGRTRPLIICDPHRPIAGDRGGVKAGGRTQICEGPLATVGQHPRKRQTRSEKRRRWTEIQTKTRLAEEHPAVERRATPDRGEEARTCPRRFAILPQCRLMRLSVIQTGETHLRLQPCSCRSSSSSLLLAFSGEGLPVHSPQAAGALQPTRVPAATRFHVALGGNETSSSAISERLRGVEVLPCHG